MVDCQEVEMPTEILLPVCCVALHCPELHRLRDAQFSSCGQPDAGITTCHSRYSFQLLYTEA
jgi:hypothetical protein